MICDDDASETEKLKSIIQQHLELNALDVDIYQTDSGESLVRKYSDEKFQFDIIFLDIEMKTLNGVETMYLDSCLPVFVFRILFRIKM